MANERRNSLSPTAPRTREDFLRTRIRERIGGSKNLHLFRGLPGSGRKYMMNQMLNHGEYIRHSGITINEFLDTRVIDVDSYFIDQDGKFMMMTPEEIAETYITAKEALFYLLDQDKHDKHDVCMIGIFNRNVELFKLVDRLRPYCVNLVLWEPDTSWERKPDECHKRSNQKMPIKLIRSIAEGHEFSFSIQNFWFEYSKWMQTSSYGNYFYGRTVKNLLDGPQTKTFTPDNKGVIETKTVQVPAREEQKTNVMCANAPPEVTIGDEVTLHS